MIFCFYTSFVSANSPDKIIVLKNEIKAIEFSNIWELESTTQAIGIFEQTAKDWEKLNEPQRAASCLNESAKLAQTKSDYESAFRLLNRAIKLETKYNLFEEKIISLSLLSLFSIDKGKKEDSRNFSEQSFSLSKNTTSVRAKGFSLFCKAMYEYYYGKMSGATNLFEQANTFAQQTQDIFLMSQTLFYVSYSYFREGNPSKAVDKMNLALLQSQSHNYKKGVALSYFGLAYISYHSNQKQKALDLFKQSNSLFPSNFEWMEKARIVNAIGNIYLDFGALELAESHFKRAITYYEKVNYLAGKTTTLTTLADVYVLQNSLSKAKETYNLAMAAAVEIDDKFRIALIEEGIGNVEFKEADYEQAIGNYLKALHIYNDIGVNLPNTENLIGKGYEKKGYYKIARKYYDSALQTNQKTRDFFQLSENLYNLSKLDTQESNFDTAINRIKQSINFTESLYADVASVKLKTSYFSSIFDRYELYINLLMRMHKESPSENYVLEALQAVEKSRARSMLESLSLAEANFTRDADVETVQREKEIRVLLNAKADKLTDLLSSNGEKSETDKISGEINELENELEEIKAKLKQQSPVYSAIKNPAPFDVGEFQRDVLDENSLLLEFSFGQDESYLWLVGKNEFSSYILPPREQIESRIEKLRGLIASREMKADEVIEDYQKRISEAESEYRVAARELSDQLFGQIADKISNKRLIIVPDGKLHYFPVSALPLPHSESNEPILLTNETVYEPSAQTLLLLEKSRKRSEATKKLLIFSDPIFTNDDARFTPENKPSEHTETADKFRFVESLNSLVRLTASKDESDSIIDIVGASETDVFSGFAANREQLLNIKTDDYKIIHFATHGLTNEQRPELSGIVLSRFDEKGRQRDEFFRIHDIYGLNLNADLVVLSACETGLGKEVKGEGLMSLNNAFMQTGAKSVMASLWKVEDGATLNLMKNFYSEMANEKLTPSQALRQAQIKLRQNPQYQSPFYWAAFTVQGDFRNVPKISGGYTNKIYLSALIPVVLLGIYLYRRKKKFNGQR
jgi:CHAT domain-containing protein